MRYFKPNRRYTNILLYVCVTCAIGIAGILAAVNVSKISAFVGSAFSILSPVLFGLAFAYLFRPIINLFERTLLKRVKRHMARRTLSLLLTYGLTFLLVFLFAKYIIPLLIGDTQALGQKFTVFIQNAIVFVSDIAAKFNITITVEDISAVIEQYAQTIISYLAALGTRILTVTYHMVIGIVLSFGILYYKEHIGASFRRFFLSFLPRRVMLFVHRVIAYSDQVFASYLSSRIIDSLIVGVMTLTVLLLVGMPYAVLVSTLMTITNMIPVLGVYLGGIPSVIFICLEDPIMAIWFIVINVIIQQIDGNILTPKIVGSAVGLPGIWIVVSVALFGGWFGIAGMFFSAPLFSLIYMLVRDAVNKRLKKKQLATDVNEYADMFASRVHPDQVVKRKTAFHFFKEKNHDHEKAEKDATPHTSAPDEGSDHES